MDKPMLRRSHNKSKLGCSICKAQRIKCDEAKPSCRNCTKRGRDCVYGKRSTKSREQSSRSESTSTSPEGSASTHEENHLPLAPRPSWYYEDSELLLHYTQNTAIELGGGSFWLGQVLNIDKENPALFHLILALSAYHLASTYSNQVAYYYEKASEHYTIALRPILEELCVVNEENARRLFAAGTLICFINFGKGPEPGQYLAFSDEGPAEWISLLDGIKMILSQFLVIVDANAVIEEVSINVPIQVTSYRTVLSSLRLHLSSKISSEDIVKTCIEELDNLSDCYVAKFDGIEHCKEPRSRFAMSWLFRLSEPFRQALQDKEPLALIVYAYYPVLLLGMSNKWPFTSWPNHILSGIKRHLPDEFHPWLSWPEQLLQLHLKAESAD